MIPEKEKSKDLPDSSEADTRNYRVPRDKEAPEVPIPFDAEKHEPPAHLSDSDSQSDDGETGSVGGHGHRSRATLPQRPSSHRSLSRTVSEVRDGIQNQRDLEHGAADDFEEEPTASEPADPNAVRWEAPFDPQNPKQWNKHKKWAAVFCVSFFTLISPVASSMVAPALSDIGRELHIPAGFQQALVLSIFVAAYALGPLFWGPLSEVYGRVIIIQISNAWFLLFNLGCALAKNRDQMLAFRFLAGIGGSAPLAIGGGVLGDLFVAEERGRAISIYSLMPVLGPAIGPIAGGWVADRTSWRWVFYSTTIACGVIQAAGLYFLKETYAPVLLHRKKKRLVKETGNTALYTDYENPDRTLVQILAIALTRPFRLLATQPIVQLLALYMMYLYGTVYLLLSTFPALWSLEYHQSTGIQSLNYISLGLGFFLGSQLCAPLQDRIYARLKQKYVPDGGPGRPEFRVPMMIPGSLFVPIGILIYSWTAEAHTHWIGPNIGALVYAAGAVICFQCIQGYLVDSYTQYAASAVGAATVLRSMAGFGFPLFAPSMYDTLGYGKGGTVLAVAAIVIGCPSPILLWTYGRKIREKSKFAK